MISLWPQPMRSRYSSSLTNAPLMDVRGVTIAEMFVGVFVLGLIGVIVVGVYTSALQFTNNEQLRIDVDVSANRILTVMDQYLRQGKTVLAQYPVTGIPTYVTGESALVFSLPSTLSDGSLSPTAIDTAVFYVAGLNLNLLISPDATSTRQNQTITITSNVKDINFRYNSDTATNSTSITVTLRTEKTVLGRPYTQILILHGTLRNHP